MLVGVGTAMLFMGALGVALAAVLAVANRRLFVYEDPRIDIVEEMLPHANCGACGTAGCRQFAELTVKGVTDPGRCTVSSREMTYAIADFLGVEVGRHERRVARLACAGGAHVARTRARYQGLPSCRAANVVAGGGKGCTWGCLGFGDCMDACQFGAIRMNRYSLPVVDTERCTACGDCVEVCPKGLFSLHPVSHRLWVACKNRDSSDQAEAECEVTCTGCGRCAAYAPEGLITLRQHLAVIDYGKNGLASKLAIERCPTGAIVWLDDKRGVLRGAEARKIVRKERLPVA
jgi:Na+-translocating ferredoxin:NAD+ oxidoreductase RNF subunit RnfB